jgi:hypothetical protein
MSPRLTWGPPQPPPPRAPGQGPLVLPVLAAAMVLQTLCTPALPVAAITCALLRWRGWRPAWFALGALGLLVGEALVLQGDLLRLHFSAWALFSVAHPFAMVPAKLIVESPIGVPLGVLVGAGIMAHSEHQAAGAEWHPATRRRQQRQQAATARTAARLVAHHREDPALPQLGVVLDHLGLAEWVAGRYVIVPAAMRGLGQLVIGMPGMGKTVTLVRLVYLAAKAGRQVVFIDCKGTDPALPGQIVAAYRVANPHARVRLWPNEPIDLWRGTPAEISNKLMGTQQFATEGGGAWYGDIAARVVQLAVEAPCGPPRNSREFMRRLAKQELEGLWQDAEDPHAMAAALQDIDAFDEQEFRGVRIKFATFFTSLRGRFDGGWGFEDADLVVCTVPAMSRRDSDAVVRALIEDARYYLLNPARKPREGKDVTVIVDEFSAVKGATEQTIDLAERARDVGGQVVLASQSVQGLGTPEKRAQLLGACTGGVILLRTADPEPFLALAGSVRTPELSWQLDQYGATGQAKAFMGERPLIDPNAVRMAPPLEGWVIQAGRAVHFRILFAPKTPAFELPPPALRELPAPADVDAAEPGEEVGAVALAGTATMHGQAHRGFADPSDGRPALPGPPGQPVIEPSQAPIIAEPGYRLRLALAAAVEDGDQGHALELVWQGQQHAPGWDGHRELARLHRAARHRRRPAILRWLVRLAHRWWALR